MNMADLITSEKKLPIQEHGSVSTHILSRFAYSRRNAFISGVASEVSI
jgi:hypothetical protein